MSDVGSVSLALAAVIGSVLVIQSSPLVGLGRVLSPVVLAWLIFLSIFIVRPLMVSAPRDYNLYGYSVVSGFGQAVALGMTALAAFTLGVLLARARRPRRTNSATPEVEPARPGPRNVLVALGALGLLGYIAGAVALAGPEAARSLVGGRTAGIAQSFAGFPTIFQSASLLGSAASCAYIAAYPHRVRRDWLFILLAMAPAVSANLTLGNRRFLLPALLAPIVTLVVVRRGRLPRVLLAPLALGPVLLASVPFVRSAGDRRPGENLVAASARYAVDGGIGQTVRDYFLSFDTEMLNYIAYVAPRLGDRIPYGLGRGTGVEFLLFPLPGAISPVTAWSDQVLTALFGGGCASGRCPVPSLPGVLLMDFGLPGLIVGTLAFGYFLRRAELLAMLRPSVRTAAFVGALGGYAPVLARGNFIHALWWLIYFSLFVWLSLIVFRTFGATPPSADVSTNRLMQRQADDGTRPLVMLGSSERIPKRSRRRPLVVWLQ